MAALEANQLPPEVGNSSPVASTADPPFTGKVPSETMAVDFSKTESSIDAQRKDDAKPDVDDLRSEAEVMEKGIYGDDVRDLIDLYIINSPPDQTTEVADDVTLEIGGLCVVLVSIAERSSWTDLLPSGDGDQE